jgi:hypothetical protein
MSNFWDESIHNITLALKRCGFVFFAVLYTKIENLPRQAQDKHRENLKRKTFLQDGHVEQNAPDHERRQRRSRSAHSSLHCTATSYSYSRATVCSPRSTIQRLFIYLAPCHACLCACLPACYLPAVYWTETPAYPHGGSANNYPLKGGKSSTLEGGVRVSAFASGGMIPPAMRGKVFSDPSQMIHVCDWYPTISTVLPSYV